MGYERTHSFQKKDSHTPQPTTQYSTRPFKAPVQRKPKKQPTPEELANETFNQHKFEAFGLQLKENSGKITPVEQERLGVLQAKMNDYWTQRRERASQMSNDLSKIPVHPPEGYATPQLQPMWRQGTPGVPMEETRSPFNSPQPSSVSPLHAKLTIGEPGDKYEQEADRVASQVVEQINSPASAQPTQGQSVQRQEEKKEELQRQPEITALQRQEEKPEELQAKSTLKSGEAIAGGEASTDLDTAINSARGGGQPLDAGLQQSMGQAMGADFSGVRVHTDAQSNQLNQSIQAKAFTTGQDVFFRQGAYEPGSPAGQELIAHELTHVVQQNGEAVQRHSDLGEEELLPSKFATDMMPAQFQTINAPGENRKGTLEPVASKLKSPSIVTSRAEQQDVSTWPSFSGSALQRKIVIEKPIRNEIGWSEAYLTYVYPKWQDITATTGASEKDMIELLKKYDQNNVSFINLTKMLEILKQELIINFMKKQTSEGDDHELESHEEQSEEMAMDVLDNAQIFGKPIAVEKLGNYFILFRSVEVGELEALKQTIEKHKIPLFTFKEGKKGTAEKMFAPNKAYVVESMGNKGKRSNMLEIIVDRAALEDVIYNPQHTTYQGDADSWLEKEKKQNLSKGIKDKPSAITLKQESPKNKKGLSYTSINIGFRQGGIGLELLAKYIVSIRLINTTYDINKESDKVKVV
ncbi:eCIS core domain-containing protein [Coleofasciculus sp. G2-EDA-02]|uniref:eCIS core domain-containing protein n=1 Tax=Coleofasciculus sp. G2-EDA-02 TaxID=3069529 RepID=UPI0033026D98